MNVVSEFTWSSLLYSILNLNCKSTAWESGKSENPDRPCPRAVQIFGLVLYCQVKPRFELVLFLHIDWHETVSSILDPHSPKLTSSGVGGLLVRFPVWNLIKNHNYFRAETRGRTDTIPWVALWTQQEWHMSNSVRWLHLSFRVAEKASSTQLSPIAVLCEAFLLSAARPLDYGYVLWDNVRERRGKSRSELTQGKKWCNSALRWHKEVILLYYRLWFSVRCKWMHYAHIL